MMKPIDLKETTLEEIEGRELVRHRIAPHTKHLLDVLYFPIPRPQDLQEFSWEGYLKP